MSLRPLEAEIETRRLGYLRLWRDDLAAMVKMIDEFGGDVEMKTDKFALDSIDDLSKVNERTIALFSLEATTDNRAIALRLSRTEAVVELRDPDVKARGIAGEIERIAKTKQGWETHVPKVAGAVAFLAGAAFVLSLGLDWTDSVKAITGVTSGLFALIAINTQNEKRTGSAAKMYARERSEDPPWLERNKDGLTTNAIVSVASLVVGFLIGWLVPGLR